MKNTIWFYVFIVIIGLIGLTITGCKDTNVPVYVCVHTFGEWIITTPSTATQEGEETRTCTKCGYAEKRPIPADTNDPDCNHAYGEWVTTTPPTATKDGEQARHCTKCGHKQTHNLPATGDPNCEHSFGE